jgi:hypothetical protein
MIGRVSENFLDLNKIDPKREGFIVEDIVEDIFEDIFEKSVGFVGGGALRIRRIRGRKRGIGGR